MPEPGEAPKKDSPKSEAPNLRTGKPEATKPDAAKTEAAKPDAAKAEAPKGDAGRIEALEKRVEKVEALEKRVEEMARLSAGLKRALALAAVALVCAIVAIVYAGSANRTPPLPKVLQVEGISVNDPNGRFHVEVGQGDSGWGIFLFDRSAVEARAKQGSATVEVPQAELRVSKNGDNRLVVRGADGHMSAVDLGVSGLGWPSVTLFDKESGTIRGQLGETQIPVQGAELEKRSPASLVLCDKQGACIWKAGETAADFAPTTPAGPGK